MTPAPNTTVLADGLAKLLGQFKDAVVVKGIITASLRRVQVFNTTVQQVIDGLDLRTGAGGVVLDTAAKIVGAPARNGQSDATMLTAILVQVLVNRSRGLVSDIVKILDRSIPGAWKVYPDYPAGYIAEISCTAAQYPAIARALTLASANGVSILLLDTPGPLSNLIRWGSDYSHTPTIGVGFDSDYTSTFTAVPANGQQV